MPNRAGSRYNRTARCPECGDTFSPQGLTGHLRYQHRKEPDMTTSRKEPPAPEGKAANDKAQNTLRIIEQLRQVKVQRQALGSTDGGDGDAWLFGDDEGGDPVAVECCAALDAREVELVNELRALEGKPPVERVTESGFLGFGSRIVLREVTAAPAPATASGVETE